jgi:hypothetical protein
MARVEPYTQEPVSGKDLCICRCGMTCDIRGQFLFSPLGAKCDPRGEVVSQGGFMFPKCKVVSQG